MSLSYFELLGDADNANKEIENYQKVTVDAVRQVAKTLFRKENSSTLFYKKKRDGHPIT